MELCIPWIEFHVFYKRKSLLYTLRRIRSCIICAFIFILYVLFVLLGSKNIFYLNGKYMNSHSLFSSPIIYQSCPIRCPRLHMMCATPKQDKTPPFLCMCAPSFHFCLISYIAIGGLRLEVAPITYCKRYHDTILLLFSSQ